MKDDKQMLEETWVQLADIRDMLNVCEAAIDNTEEEGKKASTVIRCTVFSLSVIIERLQKHLM